MNIWIAEEFHHREIHGVFRSREKAEDACQSVAQDYFGPNGTPPLTWTRGDGNSMAAYSNPVETFFFQVTRYEVDEEEE